MVVVFPAHHFQVDAIDGLHIPKRLLQPANPQRRRSLSLPARTLRGHSTLRVGHRLRVPYDPHCRRADFSRRRPQIYFYRAHK